MKYIASYPTSYLYQTPLDLAVQLYLPLLALSASLLRIMHACNQTQTYSYTAATIYGLPIVQSFCFQFFTSLAAIYTDIAMPIFVSPMQSLLSELCTKCAPCTKQLDSTYRLGQSLQKTRSASQRAYLLVKLYIVMVTQSSYPPPWLSCLLQCGSYLLVCSTSSTSQRVI